MSAIETKTVEKGPYKAIVELHHDEDPESPRDWDNVWKFAFFHRRYSLGDKEFKTAEEYLAYKKEQGDKLVSVPVRMYDHSGLAFCAVHGSNLGRLQSGVFFDPWDSGTIGEAYCTKEKLWEEYGKPLTEKRLRQAFSTLEGELEAYQSYVNGHVYGFTLSLEKGGWRKKDVLDSCWGFYDSEECLREGVEAAEYQLEKLVKAEEEAA